MTAIVFVVPAYGRLEKSRVCLRQLARTCHTLEEDGLHATAVVVADDENLEIARELGFEIVEQENEPLGRKWNDGYEAAGRLGADFVIPFGSDDWIDPILLLDCLPADNEIRGSRRSAVVSEDGLRITQLVISYEGGDGVRIFPAAMMEKVGWRPAEHNRMRAVDTSVMRRLTQVLGRRPVTQYLDVHPYQIVDWKTPGDQLNTYRECCNFRANQEQDPWVELEGRYPAEALAEMRVAYGLPVGVAA